MALIVNNCPAHTNIIQLKTIKLIILPPNTTSILQPCDQSIIQNLKYYYRTFLLRKYLVALKVRKSFKVNILDALQILSTAWNSVNAKIIENCFRHAGFSENSDSENQLKTEEAEIVPIFSDIFEKVNFVLNCYVS